MNPDRKIHFSDHLEKKVAKALDESNISFVHESEDKDQRIDFRLPDHDICIEVKQFHADRIARQLAPYDNVILLQGTKAVNFFEGIILENKKLQDLLKELEK
jgi:hypothetical protein